MGVFTLPENLAPEVYPLAWLVGTWSGEGTVGYPGIEPFAIAQHVDFENDGGPYLSYRATTWRLDGTGAKEHVWHAESGYWRVPPQPTGAADVDAGSDTDAGPESGSGPGTSSGSGSASGSDAGDGEAAGFDVECVLADPAGFVSVYLGTVRGPRIDLASDLLARTQSAARVDAATRMYGLVDSDLLWAWDLAAFGHPLQSYLAARLVRQAPASEDEGAAPASDDDGAAPESGQGAK